MVKYRALFVIIAALMLLTGCTPKEDNPVLIPIQTAGATAPAQSPMQAAAPSIMPTATPAATPTATPTPTPSPTPAPTAAPTPTPTPTPSPTPTPKPTESLPLAGVFIGIDAGHQAHGDSSHEPIAPGADETKPRVASGTEGSFTGVPEYVVNLQVALKLEEKLQALGADVLMVRRTHDVNISNAERATMMNDAGVDIVVRIHCNGDDDPSIHGILMMTPDGVSCPKQSLAANEAILKHVIAETGAKNQGILVVDYLTGFNWSRVPTTLIEMGFMTNEEEDNLLVTDAYQKQIVKGIADGLCEYFSDR